MNIRPIAALAMSAFLVASGSGTAALAGGAPAAPASAPAAEQAAPAGGVWLAGDLHVHTPYSHDSYGGPGDDNTGHEEAYLLGNTVAGNFQSAAARGLDFLAITDHNDIRSQTDPGFGTSGVTPIPGYENSLRGHAQMLGAERIYERGDQSAVAVTQMADALRADGGVFQINHPAEGSTDYPHDIDWAYGYDVVPDVVEVWNISRLWQPPMPSASSNDDAIRYWEGWLDRGYRVGATGGSDSHYVWTSLSLLGSPSTWVYAAKNSQASILEGLREGRTFISHQPPTLDGPRIFLEGDDDGDGAYEAMVGDAVVPGSSLRVRVEGAPGSFLRVLTNGGEEAFEPVPVTAPSFEHRFTLPASSTWVRAEVFDPDLSAERATLCDGAFGGESTYCRNQLAVLAMTSALYLQQDVIPTQIVYTGQTRGRGESILLSAKLSDVDGTPLAGLPVTFVVNGTAYPASTSTGGLASAVASVPDHGRSVTVRTVFEGNRLYEASEDSDVVTWGSGR